MTSVFIVYFSQSGCTEQLAQACAAGVNQQPGAHATLYPIRGERILNGRFRDPALFRALAYADAIIFGTPTFMGGPAAQFKAFADASSENWEQQHWRDKLAAGFTVGGSFNGEQGSTLQSLITLACQHGMLWVGMDMPFSYTDKSINRLGVQYGSSAHAPEGTVHAQDLATVRHLGSRVARLAAQQVIARQCAQATDSQLAPEPVLSQLM
ncbi:flavodoxin family protein [Photobacterium ganghwense]|uniref:flavodoxin family protein n=1 Tax=Photobacterium ganghwense TaxID=320778 RepID=UPI001C2D42FE|nr:flavodoxin family protein [Photobacterium ganghwense]MBV1839648.1 flavodoxin family protein [Photobacterium ganghwense]